MLANGVCHSPLRWLKNGFASKPAPTVSAHDTGNRRLHEICRNWFLRTTRVVAVGMGAVGAGLLAKGVCHSPLRWLKNGFASKPAPTDT